MPEYSMKTTGTLEHSGGIAWTADLLADGTKIGTIEQDGRGGADRVWIADPGHRDAWKTHCADLPGGEEYATYLLLCAEDGVDPAVDGTCQCEDPEPVPYVSDGPLGHGWDCGRCGGFLQAG